MAGAWNNHSKEEQPPCKLKSFAGSQASRFNKIQCPRCTKRAANEAVQGDILINGKALLFRTTRCVNGVASRKHATFVQGYTLLDIRVQIRKYGYNICTLVHIRCLHNERSFTLS